MLSDRKPSCSRGGFRSLRLWTLLGGAVALLFAGCGEDVVDRTPPAIPSGVYSITADQQVILRWTPNREADLAGYSVLWNDDGGAEYFIIATFDALDENHFMVVDVQDPSLDYVEFADRGDDGTGLANGSENWYAVLAFDHEGNESDLSLEEIRDVPRPEGKVQLRDLNFLAAESGFDFSGEVIRPATDPAADFWFETVGNAGFLNANVARVRVQDYGNVGFDVLSEAPIGGWSVVGRVEAIVGHTYAFEIAAGSSDVRYAKVTVFDMDVVGRIVDLDWAYQPVVNEYQLKGLSTRRSGAVRVRKSAP